MSRFTSFTRRLGFTLLALVVLTATLSAATPAPSPARGLAAPPPAASPAYTARIPFAVLGPAPSIGTPLNASTVATPDEAKQIIARQQFLFTQDSFLVQILQSAEFHPQDKPNQECAWFAENKREPLTALKRDLKVVPHPDAAAFEITMTAHDPMEAFSLVQSAAKIFQQQLRQDSQTRKAAFLMDLENALKESHADYQLKTDALIDYGKRQSIDLLQARFEIERNTLQSLETDIRRADTAATAAENQFKTLDALKPQGREIPLPFETLQSIESDPTLVSLSNARHTAQQDKAALEATASRDTNRLADLSARLSKVEEQIRDRRKFLSDAARDGLLASLKKDATEQRALADQLSALRKKSEDAISNIGMSLRIYQQRANEVQQAADLTARLQAELKIAQTSRSLDDTRIAKLTDPVLPATPDP